MYTIIIFAILALKALGATITIAIGREGASIEPTVSKASNRDILEFQFWAGNYSVSQGSWSTPCAQQPGGFYSGFIPGPTGDNKVSSYP